MILYYSDVVQQAPNLSYPHKIEVADAESLRQAVAHDYVSAQYKDDRRSKANYITSDCLVMDCDNDHSDDPQDWKTVEDVKTVFTDVTFGAHFSRNHMRVKGEKEARPKFHIAFPIALVDDPEEYVALKRKAHDHFPWFDIRAMDAARFFFGTPEPQVEWIEGSRNLSDFLAESENKVVVSEECIQTVIPDGQRNVTLSSYAAKVLKKWGDTDKAYQLFDEETKKCAPPLDGVELETIWSSAKRFFHNTIEKQAGYVQPKANKEAKKCDDTLKYKPTDYSDVGQAQILAKLNQDNMCYSMQTGFLCFGGTHWEEDDIKAQAMVHELTEVQLQEAEQALSAAMEQLVATGAKTVLDVAAESKAVMTMNKAQKEAFQAYKEAKAYRDYVVRRRNSAQIKATMTEVHPMVAIDPALLDANPYLMCTPEATYDLRLGLDGARPHMPEDYITKITAASPGTEGAALWQEQLETVFCGDTELIEYVQQICGTVLIGQVRIESIVIAYGSGRNGKSTFWNVIARVLGKYSGTISAEVLTTSCKHNARPELAELRGKRLVIAAEMREGAMMNDSMLKQLSSTDEITAEKKYRNPFSFIPSHTLVLYTNHLPKICADDYGTWRRLLVIPFEAVIEGSGDIKNYAEYLYEKAAPAIMSWLIEGARKAHEASYRLPVPSRVQAAMEAYREANDWFGHFLADCCDVAPHLRVGSGALYTAYREYCKATYDYTRSTKDFYAALNNKGYKSTKSKGLTYYHGLAIAQKYNCAIKRLDWQQEQAFVSSLVLGYNGIEIQRGMTTSSTAIFIPFMTRELRMDGQALYYGMNALSHNVIMADRKKLKSANGLYLGSTGSGKSFAAKRELINVFLATNDRIVVVDPMGEYAPLVKRLGGQVIEIAPDSPNHINPMDIQMGVNDEDSPLSMKADFLLSLCELIVGGKEGLQPIEKTVIDCCVRLVYRELALGIGSGDMPLLQDLYEELLRQPEPEAKRVATALELYCTGSLNLFNHHTNVQTDARVVCIVLKGMGENLRKIAMHITNEFVTSTVNTNHAQGLATWGISMSSIFCSVTR